MSYYTFIIAILLVLALEWCSSYEGDDDNNNDNSPLVTGRDCRPPSSGRLAIYEINKFITRSGGGVADGDRWALRSVSICLLAGRRRIELAAD